MEFENLKITGPHWKGYGALKHLVVFGASYCEVGYNPQSPAPSAAEPLGVPFPGKTYTEPGTANWVGYLAREFCPSGSGDAEPLLVYNYAQGGQTVNGVRLQAENQFLMSAGKKPHWAPWAADDTLFATWVGINDCGYRCDPTITIERLFEIQHTLYKRGARNFMFIDLPPMLRAPLGQNPCTPHVFPLRQSVLSPVLTVLRRAGTDPYADWNTCLHASARAFAAAHADASVFVFSAWRVFDAVLDAPEAHGFATGDSGRIAGGIWVDRMHPTTGMHRLLARHMHEFLLSVDAASSPCAG
ncbi:hypothetical protein DFH11DRAFT_1505237 [Phellopilus nigrolimitatus]|nr:hypothetical protein DFH11DRAFT_1505237 [Phellopilus nigrolimitatus]